MLVVNYRCELGLRLQVPETVAVQPSQRLEVALACPGCQRAHQTMVLALDEPARHWGEGEEMHAFSGEIRLISVSRAAERFELSYAFQYQFEPFIDRKYAGWAVEPQPSWGRISLQIACPCGAHKEYDTQSNSVRPQSVLCECGRLLLLESEGALEFSSARPVL